MNFAVNDKVVLVDDKWPETVKRLYLELPVLNRTYVVRATRVGVKADQLLMDMRRELTQSILLVGVTNGANNLGVEYGFASERFRKLDELQEQNRDAVPEVLRDVEVKVECTPVEKWKSFPVASSYVLKNCVVSWGGWTARGDVTITEGGL